MFCKLLGKRISGNAKFCDSVPPLVVWLLVAGLTLFLSTWARAQQSKKVLTNADVVSMVKAGLAESTIILAIQHSPKSFDTSPQALIELKTKGISQRILDAMLTASNEGGASASEGAVRGRARAGPSQPAEEPPRALDSASLASRVVASLGDPHALASLKAIRYTTEISAGTDANTVKVEVTQTRIYPDRLVLITRRPGGLETHLEASPAGAFTQMSGGPKVNLPGATRDELLKTVRLDRFYIGQNISSGKVKVTETGTQRIGEVEAAVLHLNVDGADVTWYVSRADGKLLRTVTKVPAATAMVDSVVDYSDWRSSDGLVVPFQRVITQGAKVSREKVLTVELNPNIAASEIATKEATLAESTASGAGGQRLVTAQQTDQEWEEHTSRDEMTGEEFVVFTLKADNRPERGQRQATIDVFCTTAGKFHGATFEPGVILGLPDHYFGSDPVMFVRMRIDDKIETVLWSMPKNPKFLFIDKKMLERILASKLIKIQVKEVDSSPRLAQFSPSAGSERVRQACGLKPKKE